MRRITVWLLATVAAVVLLFSYRTSTMGTAGGGHSTAQPAGDRAAATGPAGDGDAKSGGTSGEATASASASQPASAAPGGDGTYQGSVVQTRWGPIQVTITVANGKITKVEVPTHPNSSHRDQQINSYAIPILTKATIAAQSADVDTVTGATVTSDGYRQSLQAAIDKANL